MQSAAPAPAARSAGGTLRVHRDPAYCPLLHGDHPQERAQPGLRGGSHGLPGVGCGAVRPPGPGLLWAPAAGPSPFASSAGCSPCPLPVLSLFFMLRLKGDKIRFS